MTAYEFKLVTKDGLSLFGRGWNPPGEVRAVICLVHGLGEHAGRYEQFAGRLGERGLAVLAFDQRGFGRSPGRRGVMDAYGDLLDDVDRLLHEKEKIFSDCKCFLYGHSLGGALVLNYALRCRPHLAGVIATGPWLRLAREPGFFVTALAAALNIVRPGLSLPNGIDPRRLCRDPAVVRRYVEDPLVHNRISVRLFTAGREAGRWALAHAAEFPLPLLLMHGGDDRTTSVEASREFAARVGEHCALKVWEGYRHELHNEPANEEFFAFLAQWLEERLSR